MDRIFNLRRFGRYLAWDLRNARNNSGFSLLVYGITPIFIFVFYEICCLIFDGGFRNFSFGWRIGFIFALVVLFTMMNPSKLYGKITDKRYGSEFLLMPASTLEKFLSMIVVSAIVMPLCLSLLLLVSDSLLSLFFSGRYGEALICMDKSVFFGQRPLGSDDSITMNLFLTFLSSWWTNVFVFTLGAIFFKKSKVAKTILSYFLVSLVLSIILSAVVVNSPGINDDMILGMLRVDDLQGLLSKINFFVNFAQGIVWAVLLGLIYWRLRSLKH